MQHVLTSVLHKTGKGVPMQRKIFEVIEGAANDKKAASSVTPIAWGAAFFVLVAIVILYGLLSFAEQSL